MEKKFYWLKLNENFFEDETIQWLEEQANGQEYVLFYLKLCLKSLKENGLILRVVGDKLIPYDVKALAKLTSTPSDTVRQALQVFSEIGLVKVEETGIIYMNQINEMIGNESASAVRKRRQRVKENNLLENK